MLLDEFTALVHDAVFQAQAFLLGDLALQLSIVLGIAENPFRVRQRAFALAEDEGPRGHVGLLAVVLLLELALVLPQFLPFLLKLPFAQFDVAIAAQPSAVHGLALLLQFFGGRFEVAFSVGDGGLALADLLALGGQEALEVQFQPAAQELGPLPARLQPQPLLLQVRAGFDQLLRLRGQDASLVLAFVLQGSPGRLRLVGQLEDVAALFLEVACELFLLLRERSLLLL